MILVDQPFDIHAAQNKLLSIDGGKSRFTRHAVVAHTCSLQTLPNSAMALLDRTTISSQLPVPGFPGPMRAELEVVESLKTSLMEQTDIFSRRIRWLAIATGIASALALFPILFLLNPALLIAGGLMQPRFPTTGKWFLWAGAANLWMVVMTCDAMMFPHAFRQPDFPEYMVLMFSATTVLLAWCSAELVADALRRMRSGTSMPPAEPRPVSPGVWIFAVVLNLLLGWGAAGWLLAPRWFRYSGNLYALVLLMMKQAIIIAVAFDVFLIWRVVKLRRARARGSLRVSK